MSFFSGIVKSFSQRDSKPQGNLDFDEEARALWARLNLDYDKRPGSKLWNPVDPIWRHPGGGGIIYVGNQTAAENLQLLKCVFYVILLYIFNNCCIVEVLASLT